MGDDDNGKKRPLTRAEKFKNYCLGLGALTGIIIGLLAHLKGEPEADKANDKADEAVAKAVKAYETVTKQMNEVVKAQRKLHLRMVHIQAHDEGYRAAKMMLELQDENDKLRKQIPAWKRKKLGLGGSGGDSLDTMIGAAGPAPKKPVVAARPKPKPKPKECPPGWIRTGTRCRAVSRAVAKAVNKSKEEMLEAKRRAAMEAMRRKALEQKMKAQQYVDIPKLLPSKLADVDKRKKTIK